MNVALRQPLSWWECELLRLWRNQPDVLPMLRTGYKTSEEQYAWYINVICNRDADHKYYAIAVTVPGQFDGFDPFIGVGGLTYLSRRPGEAEISLIMSPLWRNRGYGGSAVRALINEAWNIGLTSVVGECYQTGAIEFWYRQLVQPNCDTKVVKHIHEVSNLDDEYKVYRPGSMLWRWTRKDHHEGSDNPVSPA